MNNIVKLAVANRNTLRKRFREIGPGSYCGSRVADAFSILWRTDSGPVTAFGYDVVKLITGKVTIQVYGTYDSAGLFGSYARPFDQYEFTGTEASRVWDALHELAKEADKRRLAKNAVEYEAYAKERDREKAAMVKQFTDLFDAEDITASSVVAKFLPYITSTTQWIHYNCVRLEYAGVTYDLWYERTCGKYIFHVNNRTYDHCDSWGYGLEVFCQESVDVEDVAELLGNPLPACDVAAHNADDAVCAAYNTLRTLFETLNDTATKVEHFNKALASVD